MTFKHDFEQMLNLLSGRAVFMIPKQLKILGETYKVNIVDDLKVNNKNKNGTFSHYKKEITLRNNPLLLNSAFHELLHFRNSLLGYKFDWKPIDHESNVRTESLFWKQIFEQMYPLEKTWRRFQKNIKSKENKKDLEIQKLKKQVTYWKNKYYKLKEKK